MKIKKITVLIAFVALFLSGKQALACSMYYLADCPVAQGQNYQVYNSPVNAQMQPYYGADTPNIQPAYSPVLPQIYESVTYVQPPVVAPAPAQYPQQGGWAQAPLPTPTIPPQSSYIAQPTYIPGSPVIFNGNGTYTEQNSGKTIGTPTNTTTNNTSSTTTTTTSNDSPGLWDGIFGSNKKSTFSNNVSDSQINEDLEALVNSKGLAMGTNGATCENGGQYLILYKNITGQPLSNVAVRISLPNGIAPTNANGGAYSGRDNTVTLFIGSLAKDQEGQIVITTKTTGTVSGVARTEMVYTLPNQTQNMIVSYAFGDGVCSNSNALGASVSGSGLFGGTLLGWLFLALFVSAFLYLIRFFLNRKDASHGHAAHAH